MTLTEFLQNKLNLSYDELKDLTIDEFQASLALPLRALVQESLKKGNNFAAGEIKRANLIANDNGRTFDQFVKEQSESGNWGEYLEACVLASELEFNLMFNRVVNGKSQFKYQEQCTQVKNAPLIQLDNHSYGHWEYKGRTRAEGNCLYNAFAKAIFEVVHAENKNDKKLHEILETKLQPSIVNPTTFFAEKIIAHQKSIESKIQRPTKTLEEPLVADRTPLSQEEEAQRQLQIHQDYLLALELAAEELETPSIRCKL